MMLFGVAHHGVNISFNPRSQNVPETKAEGVKPVEITKDREKYFRAEIVG